jgi:outer membrane protein OmpA-like peptidoglycan-associated protein
MKKNLQLLLVFLLYIQIPLKAASNSKNKPDNSFGVISPGKKGCDCMKNTGMANAIDNLRLETKNDTVFLYSTNLSELKRIFNSSQDGIYLDVVVRNQFSCEKNTTPKIVTISEGEMLQPIYFTELFNNNRANRNNLYAPLNKIPSKYKLQNYMVNFGIIKAKVACDYRYTKNIPGRDIDMLYLFPKYIYDENLEIIPDTFTTKLSFRIPFDRNSSAISDITKEILIKKLIVYSPYLREINIKTYSSIEGNSEANLQLQKSRAKAITGIIKKLSDKNTIINTESKENWEGFYNQVRNTSFARLTNLSQAEIKKSLQNKPLLDSMDYLLYKNRTAEIEITISAKVDNNSPPEIVLGAYKKAVENNDSLKAYRAQNRLLNEVFKKNISRLEVLNIALPKNKLFLKLWTNCLALAATDAESWYNYEARDTALKAVKIDTTYKPLQFNFCILALRYLQMYKDTLIPIQKLEYKMQQAFMMATTKSDSALVNHMWLNYSLLTLFNKWQTHSYDQLETYLVMAKKYYLGADISIDEATSLGLLFNHYGYYKWACELILPYIKRNHFNKYAHFLFVMSYSPQYNLIKQETWVKYILRAKDIDHDLFYKWVNEFDFQTLRSPEIREAFCGL